MELNEILFEQIHRYLSGQMAETERIPFLAELDTNAELRAEVETQRQIKTAYQINAASQIKQHKAQLRQIHAELLAQGKLWQPTPENISIATGINVGETIVSTPEPERRSRQVGLAYYAMAASVVAMIGIGWYFFGRPEPDSPTIAKNGNTDPKPSVAPTDTARNSLPTIPTPTTSVTPPITPTPAPAPQLANRFDSLFEQYFDPTLRRTTTDPNDPPRFAGPRPSPTAIDRIGADTTRIRQGISFLKNGKTKQAITALEPALSCALSDWQANARWFLALAYLKQQKPDLARPLLETLITGRANPYQTDAKTLLEQL